jgi:hypothetical protein
MPSDDNALRGPFLTLSVAGEKLASAFFNPAPRGLRGLEQPS